MGSSDRRARVTYFELGEEELAILAFPVASGGVLDELTPAEREVSVLVLGKLGVGSRQELAVRLAEP